MEGLAVGARGDQDILHFHQFVERRSQAVVGMVGVLAQLLASEDSLVGVLALVLGPAADGFQKLLAGAAELVQTVEQDAVGQREGQPVVGGRGQDEGRAFASFAAFALVLVQ